MVQIVLGLFGVGRLIRDLPYPVVGAAMDLSDRIRAMVEEIHALRG